MAKKKTENKRQQYQRFVEKAHQIEVNEDEAAFDRTLKKIVKPKKGENKNDK